MFNATVDDARHNRYEPPPAPQSCADFARSLTLPDGPDAGSPWRPDTEPMQEYWCQQMDADWQTMVIVAPSQRGKSLCGVAVPLLRTIAELRQNFAYVMPNLEKLEQNWHAKLRPMLDGCGYAEWIPKKGPGSQGGKPAVLVFRDPKTGARAGTLFFMAAGGGGKETSLSSVSAPVVVIDEADDLESEAQLGLGFRRTKSFGEDFRVIIASTVNERRLRDAHPVLIFHDRGTKTRLWYPCGTCGKYQALEWEQVKHDDIEARYQCAHCPALWTEAELKKARTRYRAVHDGQAVSDAGTVTGPRKAGRVFSLLGSDLDYNRASMFQMAQEYVNAQRSIQERSDHSAMRQFYHKVLCRDYRGDIEELEQGTDLTWQSLLARSAACKWGPAVHSSDKSDDAGNTYSRHVAEPPPDAAFVVAGVDVQHSRVYVTACAYSLDGTAYDFAWCYWYARADHGDWNRGELFTLLDDVDRWLRSILCGLPLVSVGLDVGDKTDDLNAWLTGHRALWKPTKGSSGNMKDQSGDIEGMVRPRDGLLMLDVYNLREAVHGALRRPNGTTGAIHLPNGLANNSTNTMYPKHLVAERRVLDQKTMKERIALGPGRWDLLDARRIAHAMALIELRKHRNAKPKSVPADRGRREADWDSAVGSW